MKRAAPQKRKHSHAPPPASSLKPLRRTKEGQVIIDMSAFKKSIMEAFYEKLQHKDVTSRQRRHPRQSLFARPRRLSRSSEYSLSVNYYMAILRHSRSNDRSRWSRRNHTRTSVGRMSLDNCKMDCLVLLTRPDVVSEVI